MSFPLPTSISYELDEYNSRIKLFHYNKMHAEKIVHHLDELADESDIGKVIVYAEPEDLCLFEELGFKQEGEISGFFDGDPACLLSKFVHPKRSVAKDEEEKNKIIQIAENIDSLEGAPTLESSFQTQRAREEDASQLCDLYKTVFKTYPTPIFEEEYVKKCMNNDVYFTVVKHDDQIVSAASADVLPQFNSAEITDCATYPEYRGKGLLSSIIFDLENQIRGQVGSLFSLTRAVSTGMNVAISKLGYEYKGRLVQNSQINGRFEDMNIWVKSLVDN